MSRETISEKIIVLGVDGMDPRLTRKYMDMGLMPNTKKIMERGSAREDLVLLGAQPTVTPPMWTTLATGAYPMTHGITCFNGQHPERIDKITFNIDSRKCKAEQLWNVFAEAGKKTLVWHWPGSSWPPSSDSPNLSVVDGITPAVVNASAALDGECMLVADVRTPEATFKEKSAADANVPCVVNNLEDLEGTGSDKAYAGLVSEMFTDERPEENYDEVNRFLILTREDGEHTLSDNPFDVMLSPIKEPANWAAAPQGAKEIVFLFHKGLIRRPALMLQDEDGKYTKVAIYKSKKETEPLAVLEKGVFYKDFMDEGIRFGEKTTCNRHLKILEMAEDGTHLKVWMTPSMDITNDMIWSPKSLYKKIVENVGYAQPLSLVGGSNLDLIEGCMGEAWDCVCKYYADSLNYCIEKEGYEIIFSHLHNLDLQGHMFLKMLKYHDGHKLNEEQAEHAVRRMYVQTDNYLGEFIHLLDKGWTIFVVSDHAAVAPEHEPPMIGDCTGVSVRLLEELGYTALQKDENGKDIYKIDWSKTKAISTRANHIYLNIKGRQKFGIIEPEEQYEVEEQLMTDLYGYKDPKTGKRVIAMALRNRDAVLLGLGGPDCGDIIVWTAEGYNYDHCDSLSTTWGYQDSSVSPIFIAAGTGIKENFITDRVIRQVDVAPTMAYLGGVRMPRQSEGSIVHQILEKEF